MDINPFFRKEYLTVDEIRSLGSGSAVAVVLGRDEIKEYQYNGKTIKVMFIDVELSKTKERRPLRLGSAGYPSQACRNLRQIFGGDTDNWIGKPIELFAVRYGEDKFTIGVKSYDIDVERLH